VGEEVDPKRQRADARGHLGGKDSTQARGQGSDGSGGAINGRGSGVLSATREFC
jgi:hypothetical protein